MKQIAIIICMCTLVIASHAYWRRDFGDAYFAQPAADIRVLGSAIRLDGSTGYGSVPDSATLVVSSAASAAIWVKFMSLNQPSFIFGQSDDSANRAWNLFFSGATIYINLTIGGSSATQNNPSGFTYTPTTNTWYFIAFTFSTTSGKVGMFLNGVRKGNVAWTGPIFNSSLPLTFGSKSAAPSWLNNCLLDEATVWSRELSSNEVFNLYNAGAGVKGDTNNAPFDTGLVALWHFDENTGTNFLDSSGNAQNGSLYGAGATWTNGLIYK